MGIFQYVVFIVVGVGLFFVTLFHIGVKERPRDVSHELATRSSRRSASNWVKWFKVPLFYQVYSLVSVMDRIWEASPLRPGFESFRAWCCLWVELFVGPLPCFEGFSTVFYKSVEFVRFFPWFYWAFFSGFHFPPSKTVPYVIILIPFTPFLSYPVPDSDHVHVCSSDR